MNGESHANDLLGLILRVLLTQLRGIQTPGHTSLWVCPCRCFWMRLVFELGKQITNE